MITFTTAAADIASDIINDHLLKATQNMKQQNENNCNNNNSNNANSNYSNLQTSHLARVTTDLIFRLKKSPLSSETLKTRLKSGCCSGCSPLVPNFPDQDNNNNSINNDFDTNSELNANPCPSTLLGNKRETYIAFVEITNTASSSDSTLTQSQRLPPGQNRNEFQFQPSILDPNTVLFKIKCTSVEKFKVVPSSGIIAPGFTTTVTVIFSHKNKQPEKVGEQMSNKNGNNDDQFTLPMPINPTERFQVHILPLPEKLHVLLVQENKVKFRNFQMNAISNNVTNSYITETDAGSLNNGIISLFPNNNDMNNNSNSNSTLASSSNKFQSQNQETSPNFDNDWSEVMDVKAFWNYIHHNFLKSPSNSSSSKSSFIEKHELRCSVAPDSESESDEEFENVDLKSRSNIETCKEADFNFDQTLASIIPKICQSFSEMGFPTPRDFGYNVDWSVCQEWLTSITPFSSGFFNNFNFGFIKNVEKLKNLWYTFGGLIKVSHRNLHLSRGLFNGEEEIIPKSNSPPSDTVMETVTLLQPKPVQVDSERHETGPDMASNEPNEETETEINQDSQELDSKVIQDLCDQTESYCWRFVLYLGAIITIVALSIQVFKIDLNGDFGLGTDIKNIIKKIKENNLKQSAKNQNPKSFYSSSAYDALDPLVGGDGSAKELLQLRYKWLANFPFGFHAIRQWFLTQGERYYGHWI